MSVETNAGWIPAVRELERRVEEAGGGEVTSDSIADATDVGKDVLTAATAAAARTAIGAGTSNLSIGTTAQTAKAGNYAPTWGEVTGKPAVIAAGPDQAAARTAIGAGTSNLTIGTTGSTAKAGNYTPSVDEVSGRLAEKPQVAALTEIADPATATAEDVATLLNSVIAALKA